MNKRVMACIFVIVGSLLLTTPIIFNGSSAEVTVGSTLHVGSGQTYSTIQSAVDAASENDMIMIHNGTYYENVVVNKTLIIVGNGPDNTIINGGGTYNAMRVNADGCSIHNLAFTGSGEMDWLNGHAGLWIDSKYNRVQNCTAYGNYYGFVMVDDHNVIVYCEAYLNEIHGIGLQGRYSEAYGCYAHHNNKDGFWMFVAPYSRIIRSLSENNGMDGLSIDHTEDTYVEDLIAWNNGAYGISVAGGGVGFGNQLHRCLISGNGRGGIELYNAEGPALFMNNTIRENRGCGINITRGIFGSYFTISGNLIDQNEDYGIRINSDCTSVRTFKNDIKGNGNGTAQAFDANTNNIWYNVGLGNYWSDWTTPDNDSDGIVDSPYGLDGNTSEADAYPLVSPQADGIATGLTSNLWENGKWFEYPNGSRIEHQAQEETPDNTTDDGNDTVADPDIELQDEPYVGGSAQVWKVPDNLLNSGNYSQYEWYIEGKGLVGMGVYLNLNLPKGSYNITLVGKDRNGTVQFSISKIIVIEGPLDPDESDGKLIVKNLPGLIMIILTIMLIVIAFAFILGKRRKAVKELEEKPDILIPGATSGPVSTRTIGGDLEFTTPEMIAQGRINKIPIGAVGVDIPSSHENGPVSGHMEFEKMKVLSASFDEVQGADRSGSAVHRVKAKLDRQLEDGTLDGVTYQELNGILSEYL